MGEVNVILADDHVMVRHGLKQLLDREPTIRVVGEASNGNEVFDLIETERVDVVVLDITMPGRNGLETLKEIKRQFPKIQVLMLSMHPGDQYAVRVLKAGASGYLTKESAPDELVKAIHKANRGEKYISPDVADILADFIHQGATDHPHKLLSDREFEVFCMIGSGLGLTRIAEKMNLSVKTISTYRSRIIDKTGLSTNGEITRYTIERGLV